MSEQSLARHLWGVFEPLHAVTYFAPAAVDERRSCGLKGFWMGYFAGRAAPMGPVGAAVVEATFYNFSPTLVRRAIPDAWGFASPERVLVARLAGTTRALAEVLPTDGAELRRAVALAGAAVSALGTDGRPLAAANAALDVPDEPLGALWQLCTTLREHRGDGHLTALVEAELDGLEAHVTLVATGAVQRTVLQPARGWSDEQWSAVEQATDRLARAPWETLGPERSEELRALLDPWAQAVARAGMVPTHNPMGLPAPHPG